MTQRSITNKSGISLWTDDTGHGAPVLLIAGANASALMWPDEFADLIVEKGYRVIRYDHRDTGKSDRINFETNPYSIADLCEDAIAVLDELNIQKAHVVGLSLGGTIGQVLALDYPDRLLSLTLMMTAALDVDFSRNWMLAMEGKTAKDTLPTPKPEIVRAFQAPVEDPEAEIRRRVAQWKLLSAPGAAFDEADYMAREKADIQHSGVVPAPLAHALAAPIPLIRGDALKYVDIPTLVIQAMEDPLNPPPHGQHLADLIPNSKLVEIEGLGHALPKSVFAELVSLLVSHWNGSAKAHVA